MTQGGLATQGSIGTSLQPRPPTQGGLQMQPLGQPLSVGPRAPAGYTAPVGLGAAPTGSGYGQVQGTIICVWIICCISAFETLRLDIYL